MNQRDREEFWSILGCMGVIFIGCLMVICVLWLWRVAGL
jgi:hypothetical protein